MTRGAIHHHLRALPFTEQRFIAFGNSASPYIQVYKWDDATGFGTKYDNPSTLPAAATQSIAWNPVTKSLAVCNATSPYLEAYQFTKFGFGAKHSAPATTPARNVVDLAFSPDGAWLLVGLTSFGAYQIMAYPWSEAGFGASPFTANLGANVNTVQSVCWHPSGDAVGVGINGNSGAATMITIPFNASTGFGAQYADPASVPTGNIREVRFSPSGGHFIGVDNSVLGIAAWPFNTSTGNGTKFTTSINAGSASAGGLAVDSDGSHIVSTYTTNFGEIAAWPLNPTSFGTKGTSLFPGLGDGSFDQDFSVDGGAWAGTFGNSPYVKAYAWSGTAFGAAYSNPATTPAQISDLVFGKA